MIVFGNISLNPKGFVNTSKEEFMNLFKGKTNQDLNAIWEAVKLANKDEIKHEEPKESEEITPEESVNPFNFMGDKSEKKKFKKK
jgi:hypothetical protein